MAQQTVLEIPLDDDLFKVLASESRREILRALQERRMTGTELATRLSLGKPAVSEHLKKLHEAKLVDRHDDAERRWVYFSLTQKGRDILEPKRTRFILLLALGIAGMLVGLAAGMALYGALDGEGLRPDQVTELTSGGPGEGLAGQGLTGDYVVLPKANVDLANGTFTGPYSVVHDPDPVRPAADLSEQAPVGDGPGEAPAPTDGPANETEGPQDQGQAETNATSNDEVLPMGNGSVAPSQPVEVPTEIVDPAVDTVTNVTSAGQTPGNLTEEDVTSGGTASVPGEAPSVPGETTDVVTQTITVCTTQPVRTTTTITTTGTTTLPVTDLPVDPLTGLVADATTTTQTVGVQEVVKTSNRTTCTTTTSTAPPITSTSPVNGTPEPAGAENGAIVNTTTSVTSASVPSATPTVDPQAPDAVPEDAVTTVVGTATDTATGTSTDTSVPSTANGQTDTATGDVEVNETATFTTNTSAPDLVEVEPSVTAPTHDSETVTETPTDAPPAGQEQDRETETDPDDRNASQDAAGHPAAGALQDGGQAVTAPLVGPDAQPLLLVAFGLVLLAFVSRRWT